MRFLIFFLCLSIQPLSAQCLKGNCKNGHSTYRFEDGSTFEGKFVKGKIGDKGILYFANGDKYLGQWQDQKRHGEGKLVFKTGDVYIGSFKSNRFDGYGEFRYVEGDVYKGQWKDNLPNGEGTYYYADGKIDKGIFIDGALEGKEYTEEEVTEKPVENKVEEPKWSWEQEDDTWDEDDEWDDDFEEAERETMSDFDTVKPQSIPEVTLDTIEEEIMEDVIPQRILDCNKAYCHDESGRYVYNDGSVYDGEFWDGYPEGQGKCQYASGDKYIGGWHNHSPHGTGIMYFANGKILSAEWDHGQPTRELKASESLDLMSQMPVDTDDETKVWAVVIGVSRYNHMPVLRYSDDDAYKIYAFLKSPEGGALPDEQVRILIDEDATREKILQNLQQTLLKADRNDAVFVYFSGHGLEGSFVPIDFDGFSNLILHDEVIEILGRSEARYKMCFADACYSGSLTAQKGSAVEETIEKYYNAFLDKRGGTAFMLSSKAEEFSLEDGGLRQGVFSHFLIRGMKGEADVDFDDVVTIAELYDFVRFEVRRYTGNVQTPVMVGKYDEGMPVSVVR